MRPNIITIAYLLINASIGACKELKLSACSQEVDIIKAQSFVDLLSYIEDSVEVGNFVFKLADLYNFFQGRLTDSGVDIYNHS